mmetsp:Transcript_116/g.318  ORF Transcript_116/g.318 Transcript_116/m.318 type:complete len:125 (-) Transcript_116:795-1169(-)
MERASPSHSHSMQDPTVLSSPSCAVLGKHVCQDYEGGQQRHEGEAAEENESREEREEVEEGLGSEGASAVLTKLRVDGRVGALPRRRPEKAPGVGPPPVLEDEADAVEASGPTGGVHGLVVESP